MKMVCVGSQGCQPTLHDGGLHRRLALGDPRSRQRIQADRTSGRNPTCNATLRFTVPASNAGSLHVLLHARGARPRRGPHPPLRAPQRRP
jgi:hypothetical protein